MSFDRDLFLPVSRADMDRRGWDFYDFLLITGDAYVDHPSFGPTIDPEKCKGCGKCRKNCPMEAITGAAKQVHVIDPEKCINCGACVTNCPFGAIAASK